MPASARSSASISSSPPSARQALAPACRACRAAGSARRCAQRHRPAVESLGELEDRHAGLRVAGHQRALDRRGAAPARQQRRDARSASGGRDSSGSRISWPNSQTQIASGATALDRRRAPPASFTLAACSSGDAELARRGRRRRRRGLAAASLGPVGRRDDQRRAVRRRGERASARRPRSRSCRGRRSARGAAALQRVRRLLTGLVRSATRRPRAAMRSASLRCSLRRAVEDQHAVEVVHLVLDHARLEPGRLEQDRLAVLVLRADAHVQRALDVDRTRGRLRQPSSAVSCSSRGPLELRVHDRHERRVRARPGR